MEEMVFQVAVHIKFQFQIADGFLKIKPVLEAIRRFTPTRLKFLLAATDLGFEVDHECVEVNDDEGTVIGNPGITTGTGHACHEAWKGPMTNPLVENVRMVKNITHQEESHSVGTFLFL